MCLTWSETPKTGFLTTRFLCTLYLLLPLIQSSVFACLQEIECLQDNYEELSDPLIQSSVFACLQEIECLQDNYEELSEGCRLAVGNFTEDEDEDINLDKILMKACTPMIKKFCQVMLRLQLPRALYTNDKEILSGNA